MGNGCERRRAGRRVINCNEETERNCGRRQMDIQVLQEQKWEKPDHARLAKSFHNRTDAVVTHVATFGNKTSNAVASPTGKFCAKSHLCDKIS